MPVRCVCAVVAWALANGFTGSEVERLRDYAAKALTDRRFRPWGWAARGRTSSPSGSQDARERGLDFTKPDTRSTARATEQIRGHQLG